MIRRLVLVLLTLTILFGVVELDARGRITDRKWWMDIDPTRAVYSDALYDVAAFRAEAEQIDWAWNYDLLAPTLKDMQGTHISAAGGWRTVTGQSANAEHTIYLYGSSVVEDLYVPDEYTIASQLQALVGDDYRVVNRGLSGVNVWTELHILKTDDIKAGDIVIFYDGVFEVDAIRREWQALDGYGPCAWFRACADLSVYKLNCDTAPLSEDDPRLGGVIRRIVAEQRRAIQEAHDYATARGAAFYHFLMPHMYTIPLSDDERLIKPSSPAWLVNRVWPLLVTPYTVEITHVLDDARLSGVEVFVNDPL